MQKFQQFSNVYELLVFSSSFKLFFREAFLLDYIYKYATRGLYSNWIVKGALVVNFSFLNSNSVQGLFFLICAHTERSLLFFNSDLRSVIFIFIFFTVFILSLTSLIFICF